jgi:hypothetical protein
MPSQKSAPDRIALWTTRASCTPSGFGAKRKKQPFRPVRRSGLRKLSNEVRTKLRYLWNQITQHRAVGDGVLAIEDYIGRRTLESIAFPLKPEMMAPNNSSVTNDQLLSLIEAEHEVLLLIAADPSIARPPYPGMSADLYEWLEAAPERFRQKVNQIFEAHIVGFHLHQNSHLVPIESHEMHTAVVEPTLYLLHSQPQFAAAEAAYQKALKELRVRDAGDAITDAGVALQEVLTALGCEGKVLGDLLKSARKIGLIRGKDTPLTESIGRTVDWVATMRNQGEAHKGNPDVYMSDAWMVVHVVGALIVRLAVLTTDVGDGVAW